MTGKSLRNIAPFDAGLAGKVRDLGPWFQNVRLPGGLETAPDPFLGDYPKFKFERFAGALPPISRASRSSTSAATRVSTPSR